ncbi:uncharacterized protein V1516DRAFT_683363 [Lipomyces oligophaga]|uniref:uncharacterized protein n=1 Tax=Lipomyces oligophaga TaxID=45792 RepID=UPI0034CFE438
MIVTTNELFRPPYFFATALPVLTLTVFPSFSYGEEPNPYLLKALDKYGSVLGFSTAQFPTIPNFSTNISTVTLQLHEKFELPPAFLPITFNISDKLFTYKAVVEIDKSISFCEHCRKLAHDSTECCDLASFP